MKDVKEQENKTIRLFGMDLECRGQLHECYRSDAIEGVNDLEYQNKNLPVNNVVAELEGR